MEGEVEVAAGADVDALVDAGNALGFQVAEFLVQKDKINLYAFRHQKLSLACFVAVRDRGRGDAHLEEGLNVEDHTGTDQIVCVGRHQT